MLIFKWIYLTALLIWVGGLSFIFMVLRKWSLQLLTPSVRLKLWSHLLAGFFNWVWLAYFCFMVSGMFLIYRHGGIAQVPLLTQILVLFGGVQLLSFCHVFFFQFVHFSRAVSAHDWLQAEARLKSVWCGAASNGLLGLIIFLASVATRW